MPGVYTFYDGSTILKPLEEYVGIEVDKINFVLCMFSSLSVAYYYQKRLSPDKVSRQTRVLFPLLIGLLFCFFCFGRAVKHLLANCLISYAVMYFSPPKYVHLTVFTFSMGYLLWIHFYRWMILTSYSLDITGPMMVGVQKITTLAFSYHDGMARRPEELTNIQRKEAIKEIPPLLDYMSYIFNFQTGMTGPVNYYADYCAFIDGVHQNEIGWSNTYAALRKMCESFIYMFVVMFLASRYPPEIIATKYYMEEVNCIQWFFTWYMSLVFVRANYYFAWTFGDAICNMSGFGYSGKNANGEAQWNLCTNVYPQRVENAQNMKEVLDNWNTQTAGWLRRVAYDRTPKNIRTLATYMLSAVWHGVSVGYYITFISGALFTPAAATFRRCMRHRFVDDPVKKVIYDVFSNITTKIALAYLGYPFIVMNLHPAVDVYWRIYFIGHFIALAILYALPKICKPSPSTNGTQTDKTDQLSKSLKMGQETTLKSEKEL